MLAIGFGPAPGASPSSAQAALDLLRIEDWRPVDGDLAILLSPWLWWPAADFARAAADSDAVILLTGGDSPFARVSGTAGNRAEPGLRDVAGYRWAGSTIAPGSPPLRSGSLPAEPLARALGYAGLEARVRQGPSRPGAPNRAFYSVLEAQPRAALIELPLSVESARTCGQAARYNRFEIVRGVQAALSFAAAAAVVSRPAPASH